MPKHTPSAGQTLGTMPNSLPVNPRWGDARARHPNRMIHAADALRSAQDFGNKAQIPYLGGAGDLLLGGAQDVAERLAYGDRITTGTGQARQLHPGTVDLASLAFLPAAITKMSAGLGADLAAGFAKNILAGKASVDLGRRSALKKIGAVASAPLVFGAGARVVDELLAPMVKATAAPVARGGLGAATKKAASTLVGEWNSNWLGLLGRSTDAAGRTLADVAPNVHLGSTSIEELTKVMATSLEKIIAKYPNAVLDKATLARFDIRGAQRKAKLFKRNPDYNAYKEMGLKTRSRGEFFFAHEKPPLSAAQSRKMSAAREFLDELDPPESYGTDKRSSLDVSVEREFRGNRLMRPSVALRYRQKDLDVAPASRQTEAEALVERWQATGKWGTHTPNGTRIPDGVDMDYFDPEDWMARYDHDVNLPHEDSIAELLLHKEFGFTPEEAAKRVRSKPIRLEDIKSDLGTMPKTGHGAR